MRTIKAVDFFCGGGGLTCGLQHSGINVFAGIDFDENCEETYERNNGAIFINKSIVDITAKSIKQLFNKHTNSDNLTMIAGCAPCQPYSAINRRKKDNDYRKTLLDEFTRVINGVKPHFVLMENVSGLNKGNSYFDNFINMLDRNGYQYEYKVLNAKDYGVSQNRKRLFFIASRLKRIKLSFNDLQSSDQVLLKDVIVNLENIEHNRPSSLDNLHRSKVLNELNLRRIKATPKNGGTRKNWTDDLKAPSHKKKNVFIDNYGRLHWDKLCATITTKFSEHCSGRFGHPEQDRALSLREGALIQTFPQDYQFFGSDTQISRQIGNAVPVKLAKSVGDLFSTAISKE